MGQELPTRSLRSNPATYLKIYDDIRKLFRRRPRRRGVSGIKPRDFSFNVEGGRCEKCHGTGTVTIEMHFMADLEVQCDAMRRPPLPEPYPRHPFQGRNINEVLDLTVDEAVEFFIAVIRLITKRLEALAAVGLGYLRLGQTTSTLSGGEAQRLKLARFLLADLEPPPAGDWRQVAAPDVPPRRADHRARVRRISSDCCACSTRLVAEGNTLVVIEHNLEFIAQCDYVIDLGRVAATRAAKSSLLAIH